MKKFLIIILIFTACGQELIVISPDDPSAILTVGNFMVNEDQITGSVTGQMNEIKNNIIIEHGHCWDTSPMPTVDNESTNLGTLDSNASFTSTLQGYELGTTYYVRAYARSQNEVFYSSNEIEFKVSDVWIKIETPIDFIPVSEAVAFELEGKGYLLGGFNDARIPNRQDRLWVFEPERDDFWGLVEVECYFPRIASSAIFKIDGTPYIGGGSGGGGCELVEIVTTSLSERFCPITYEYKTSIGNRTECLGGEDYYVYPVGFSINGKGFLGIGFDYDADDHKDFWEYDPIVDSWRRLADFADCLDYLSCRGRRGGAIGFSIGNIGYVGLGRRVPDITDDFFDDFWAYDLSIDEWVQKSDFNGVARAFAVSFVINDVAYVGLGENQNGDLLNDFWKYDAQNDTWTQLLSDFPGQGRKHAVAFVIDGVAYVGTGLGDNSTYLNDFYKYIPD